MDKVAIFAEALQITTVEARSRFLDEACQDNSALRQEIDALLSAHDDAGSFLQKTPEGLAATSDSSDALQDDGWKSFLKPSEDTESLGTLAQYEVLELIGRGGMGVVLRAHDPKLKRIVAIKLLAPSLAANTMAVRRFLREAQAAAAVSGDHVVTIHAIDEDANPPLIVMEYVEGKSLQQKLDSEGALDIKSILRIGIQTATGLEAAHRQGLVHRDVKPANILLENGIERVKLTDFGLARAIDDVGMTQTGTITGTPQYMSPEQAQGQRVDHRTDLFSLGCVLYAMCTGRAAFRADSAVAVMHCVVHEPPRPIQEINEDIPQWLCDIVTKLLAKHPDDRFSSSAEVESLLSRHLAHLQQPDSVPQPEALPKTKASGDAVLVAGVGMDDSKQLPGWFFLKIPPWMLGIPVLLFVLLGLRTNQERATVLLTLLLIGGPLGLLTYFLRGKQIEEGVNGKLYSGYPALVGIGLAIAFSVAFLLWQGSDAVFVALLASAITVIVLSRIRSESYTAIRDREGDGGQRDWEFATKMIGHSWKTGIYCVLLIAVIWLASVRLVSHPTPFSNTPSSPTDSRR